MGNPEKPTETAQNAQTLSVHLYHNTGGAIQEGNSLIEIGPESGGLHGSSEIPVIGHVKCVELNKTDLPSRIVRFR